MAEEKLEYKGRPLARVGNEVFYGSPTDPCVVYMQIISSKEVGGVPVADRVQVMLMSTDGSLSMKDRIKKVAEKNTFYSALEIGSIWLEKELGSKK